MRLSRVSLHLLFLTTALAGCATQPDAPVPAATPVPTVQTASPEAKPFLSAEHAGVHERKASTQTVSFSLRDCEAVGGKVRPVGRSQTLTCVIPYMDAGKSCHDGSECMGLCVAPPTAAGKHVQGTCSRDSGGARGCYSQIRKGRALPGICPD